MNICLIGYGVSSLILGNVLTNKNIRVSIIKENKVIKKNTNRTVGIAKNNIDFLKKQKIDLNNYVWPINKIKIFNESVENKEILNFGQKNNNLFSIIKNSQLINILEKKIKKNKLIKIIKKKEINFYNSIIENNHEFDLVINFNEYNKISKEKFYRRHYKDYKSLAYTTLIKHKECDNKCAYQIFSKYGPVAFLPLSKFETSVVFSILKDNNNFFDEKIIKLIKKYNKNYFVKSFSKIEKFELKGSLLKNYYYKNILCFGDNIHKIHPLAGQGLNMTIRDIKIISDLIDNQINLGLPLDKSILREFEKETKHLNYLYSQSINLINGFFNFDNKFKNNYSKKIFNFLENNSFFKKYSTMFADKGIF